MGVRAPEGAHAPVKIVRQRELFARGLGVEIDEREGRLLLRFQKLVRRGERIRGVEAQVAAADEVHHRDARRAAVVDRIAASRHAAAEVRGAQDIGAVVEVIADLHFAEGVVAERDDVRARGEDVVRVIRRQADHRGVFAVDNREMDALALLEAPQAAAQVLHAARAHHVAHREDVIDHSGFSSVSVS